MFKVCFGCIETENMMYMIYSHMYLDMQSMLHLSISINTIQEFKRIIDEC